MSLGKKAKQLAVNAAVPHPHPAKLAAAPDPPITASTLSHASPGPGALPSPHLPGTVPAGLGVPSAEAPAFRPHVSQARLGLTLERASAALPQGAGARLVAAAEDALGGRTLDQLTAAETGELRAMLQGMIAKSAPGAERLQRELREQMRDLRGAKVGADLAVSSAPAPGGTWLFYHSRSKTDPVIAGEAFVPVRPDTPVPVKPPDPAKAGLAGQPRWRGPDGELTTVRPPLPATPVRARSELGPQALDLGPDLVLAEIRRAQTEAAVQAAAVTRPRKLDARGLTASRTGTRIFAIERHAYPLKGGAYDEKIVVRTVTGPESARLPDSELDKILPPAGKLGDPRFQGYARCHAVGPILGDETLAGLAYAPHELFNLLQKNTIEDFLRWNVKRSGRLNVKAGSDVTVSVYLQHVVTAKGDTIPLLRAAHYDVDLGSGSRATVVLSVDEAGKVDIEVR
ncbi:polymorphic toxin type 4 domain-containing protein [Sphaerisporangium aureirubrum]|uniref:Polymorphic toxin type 4 domain-containing protein n=1 Tax=Sphaerisporangium aureirubrum TaxID=1544736 RepID=A0ABW1NSA7_9ACTN